MTLRLIGIALTAIGLAHSQTGATSPPAFDSASVKPSEPMQPGDGIGVSVMPGGRFSATNTTLKLLIAFAFNVRQHQISGGPAWIDSEKFDLEANPGSTADIRQVRRMVQTLLADRFELKLRREITEMPVYALTVARNGPKLAELKPGGAPPIMRIGWGTLNAQGGATMAQFAAALSFLDRPVLDETGLSGAYEIRLEWTPGESETFPKLPGDSGRPDDPAGPSIFTALQEQLGLKLESTKGSIEALVISQVAKPSGN